MKFKSKHHAETYGNPKLKNNEASVSYETARALLTSPALVGLEVLAHAERSVAIFEALRLITLVVSSDGCGYDLFGTFMIIPKISRTHHFRLSER